MEPISRTFTQKVEKFIEKHEKFCVIIMMIISSIILAYPLMSFYPLHTTTDELGAIVGAASLAGYDWSGVIDRSGYYGFGYYSLFAPLFKLHLSPIVIYRIILVVTRILRASLISGIAYYIGKHYYKFTSKLNLIMLSIICTIPLHPNDDANIINDVILDACFWFMILTLCKIVEHIGKTSKCIEWIFLYIITSFSCSFLHTRALVMIIASFLVLLGLILYKRQFVLFLSILVVPMTVLSKKLISAYQNSIWGATGEGLRNASVEVTSHLPIWDRKTWEIWLNMLIGHISVQTLLTGGLFLLAIVALFKYLYMLIRKKEEGETIFINVVFTTSILCIGAAFAAFLVSGWFMGMYDTWDTIEKGQVYNYKALCYVRYWNVFAMPFLFTGIYLIEKKEYSDCIKRTVIAGIVILLGFVRIIVPIVKTHSSAASFLFNYLTDREEKVTIEFYYKSILFCMIFIAVAVVLYYKKNSRQWAILPIIFLMVIGYFLGNANYNKPVTEKVSSMVLSSYEQKCRLQELGVDIGQIYAFDDRNVDSNWYIFSVLQFYFYEYRIEDDYPNDLKSDDIIITNRRSKEIETDFPQLDCYRLDENEVWYTNLQLIGYKPIER